MGISLGGLASGMDTQAVIDQLVSLEMRPIYRYEKEISNIEEEKGAWRDVNSRLKNLDDTLTDLKFSSTYNSRTTTSSNEDLITASASNSALESTYDITIHSTAKSQRIAGTQVSDTSTALKDLTNLVDLSSIAAENTININGTDITVKDTDTLKEMSNKINQADADVISSIVDNRLVIETNETGEINALDSADPNTNITDSNGLLENLGLLNADGTISNEVQTASNAEIDINGITGIIRSSNEFSDVVDGVTFNIDSNAVSNDGITTAKASINISKDIEKTVETVKSFVEQYNSLMSFIDTKSEYNPATGEGSVLQGDSTLTRIQTNIRLKIMDSIETGGDLTHISQLGISIDREGVMTLDNDKLSEALENNSESVANFFSAENDEDGYDGIATSLEIYTEGLIKTNTGLIPNRIDSFDDQIQNLNDDIEDIEASVEMSRERYTQQFTAMETALSNMQQQQSWMTSQLASLGNSSSLLNSM